MNKTCPWCNTQPEIVPWHGGAATSTMVSCPNNICPVNPQLVRDTEEEALEEWNTRIGDSNAQGQTEQKSS